MVIPKTPPSRTVLSSIVVCALATTLPGCFSYYSSGPEWAPPAAPADGGLVVLYRPKKAYGAGQSIHAIYKTRQCELVPGAYCVFYFPPGDHTMLASIMVWSEVMVTTVGPASSPTSIDWSSGQADEKTSKVSLHVSAGQTQYVEVTYDDWKKPPLAQLKTSASEVSGLHLAPGGLARRPVAEVPGPVATAPSAAAPKP